MPWRLTAESKRCFSHPRPSLAKGLCGEPKLLRVICHFKTQANPLQATLRFCVVISYTTHLLFFNTHYISGPLREIRNLACDMEDCVVFIFLVNGIEM